MRYVAVAVALALLATACSDGESGESSGDVPSSDDGGESGESSGDVPSSVGQYLGELEANGYGDYFASDRAAVLYVQNHCKSPTPRDELDELVEEWCDDEELLNVDPSAIEP